MELLHIDNEIDLMTERREIYLESLKSMKSRFKRQRVKRILFLIKTDCVSMIAKDDMKFLEEKINKVDEELEDSWKKYSEKAMIRSETKIKVEDIKLKKEIYSQQLCDFINSLDVAT